jgi:hypothetical protein
MGGKLMDYRKLYDGIDSMRVVLADAVSKTEGLESKSEEHDLREFRDRIFEAIDSVEAAQGRGIHRELLKILHKCRIN